MRKGSIKNSTSYKSGYDEFLVLAPNWLGDVVMATPFLSALRDAYPENKITVFCRGYVSALLSRNPFFDRLVSGGKRGGFLQDLALLGRSRPLRRYKACFILPPSLSSALKAVFSGARDRVGYATDNRKIFLTHSLSASLLKKDHLSRSYKRLLDNYRGRDAEGELSAPVVVPPAGWAETVREMVGREDYLVLAPGATYGSAKRWPAERYGALSRRLKERTGWRVVMTGSEGERDTLAAIDSPAENDSLNLAGKCDLSQLISILRGAKIVIGNDSGPVHIAAALGIPTLAIFGSTNPAWTAPRGEKVEIMKKDVECAPCFKRECPDGSARCLLDIEVEEVYRSALRLGGCA
ncbi:MAG: lipopolysaccharide heptosyltransferase II [Candidatus Krumholzibacteriota bacterium]|nr:lipopolysaccharide heptosyltransferase II [Candidatus Krumholzibacteriota bacterium]